MANMSIKIAITKMPGVVIQKVGKKDTRCVCIPIEYCGLYEGQNETVYMEFTGIPLATPKQGSKDTHIVKQSFSKEKFASMTDEQKKSIPIIGNVIDWGLVNGTATAAPQQSATNNNTSPEWL